MVFPKKQEHTKRVGRSFHDPSGSLVPCLRFEEMLQQDKPNSCDPLVFPFLSSARLEGMWTEAFDMASSSKGSSLYTSHVTQDRCAILSTIAAIRGPFNRTAAARRRRSGIDVRRSVHALHGTERVSMPSSGEIRTVELTWGRETGAAILPYVP